MANDRTSDCPSVEELGVLVRLPEDDARRRHLRECPRCRARLTTYREFMAGEIDRDREVPGEVLDRLGDAIDSEIFGAAEATAESAIARLFHWRSPVVRSALAIAATLLFFVAVDGRWPGSGPRPIRLRSDRPEATGGELLQPRSTALADGGVELRWQPSESADGYRVEILDSAFTVQAELPVETGTSLRLPAARLNEVLPGTGAYVWVVVALRGGDEILRSAPTAFVFGNDS